MGTESIAELNSAFATERAARLNTALQTVMDSKTLAPTPPKGKGTVAASQKPAAAAPASPAAGTSTSPAAGASADDALGAVPDVQAALGEPSSGADPEVAPELDAPQGEAEPDDDGAAAVAPEIAQLQELGKKKDLRALEKALGLEEGSLGVNNGSWKAYRNRLAEVEAKETEVAKTQEKNEALLVAKFGVPYQLIESASKGDLLAYGQLCEQTTGLSITKFIQLWTANVRQVDPQVLELQRENLRLKQSGNLIEAKPDGTAAPVEAAPKAAAIAKADAYISAEAANHPALKLTGGAEAVRAKWLSSYDKRAKAFTLSPKAAADAVVAERKATIEREQWILSGKPQPKPPQTRTLPRRGASETQPRDSTKGLTRAELVDRAAEQWARDKARERRRAK